jgi:hypothetical protein
MRYGSFDSYTQLKFDQHEAFTAPARVETEPMTREEFRAEFRQLLAERDDNAWQDFLNACRDDDATRHHFRNACSDEAMQAPNTQDPQWLRAFDAAADWFFEANQGWPF